MSLQGKVALVTGSTSGIGEGIAKRLAAAGCNIVLNGFGDEKEINALKDAIAKEHTVKVHYSAADMSKADAIEAMIHETEKTLGPIDILVNNAGIQFVSPVEEFPVEKWDAIIAINLTAAFHTSRHVVAGMRQRGYGRIINVASAHGLRGSANKSAYVAAKHGIVGLTKVMGLENAGSGVTCNAICPGWVLTPLVQKQIDANAAKGNISGKQAEKELLAEKQPSLQFVTPDQIGALTVFLCQEEAAQITGTTQSIDGGWTAK